MKMLTMWKVAILEEGFPTFPFLVSTTSSFSSLCFTWLAKNGLLLTIFKISGCQKNKLLRTIFKILLWIITKLTLQPFSGSFQDLDPADCSKHNHHNWLSPLSWLSYRTKRMIDNHLSSNQLGQARSEVWTINLKIQETLWLKSLQFCHPCQAYHCHRVFHLVVLRTWKRLHRVCFLVVSIIQEVVHWEDANLRIDDNDEHFDDDGWWCYLHCTMCIL